MMHLSILPNAGKSQRKRRPRELIRNSKWNNNSNFNAEREKKFQIPKPKSQANTNDQRRNVQSEISFRNWSLEFPWDFELGIWILFRNSKFEIRNLVMPALDQLLRIVVKEGGSDLHIGESQPPKMRKHGDVAPIRPEPML